MVLANQKETPFRQLNLKSTELLPKACSEHFLVSTGLHELRQSNSIPTVENSGSKNDISNPNTIALAPAPKPRD